MTEKKYKTTQAQREASKRWREKNKQKASIQSSKRASVYFIRNHATLAELDELVGIIEERKKLLKNP